MILYHLNNDYYKDTRKRKDIVEVISDNLLLNWEGIVIVNEDTVATECGIDKHVDK